jgi:glycosyltransferase involved in cell wall biosynthesis
MSARANGVLTSRTSLKGIGQLNTHIQRADVTSTAPVTVVICAFSSARLTQTVACVDSVLRQDPPPGQIIIVVDHNDALLADLRARLPEDVEIVANPGPRGLSSARNAAVARSRGEYIAFIDDDAVAHDEWLINLVSAFADRTVIGAGGHAHPLWA